MGSWQRWAIGRAWKGVLMGTGRVARQLTFEHDLGGLLGSDLRGFFREAEHESQRPTDYPLYAMVRALRPSRCVETGVGRGNTSAIILSALERNGGPGQLYSVDLPTYGGGRQNADGKFDGASLANGEEPGTLIPPALHERWHLLLGDTRTVLPHLLEQVFGECSIDLFYHDSDHAYSVQMFEYRAAWKALRPGGLLVSDDIDWCTAFKDFAGSVAREPIRWALDARGVIRK